MNSSLLCCNIVAVLEQKKKKQATIPLFYTHDESHSTQASSSSSWLVFIAYGPRRRRRRMGMSTSPAEIHPLVDGGWLLAGWGRVWGKVQECKADSQQSIRELFVLSLLSPVNFDYHVSRCIIIITVVVVVLPLVIYLPYPTQQHQQQRPECRSCSNGAAASPQDAFWMSGGRRRRWHWRIIS